MKLKFLLVTIFALWGNFAATAHQVDSVELEFLQPEGEWKLEGLLDIAYMLPEIRGVEGSLPLFRKDVMEAPPAEHERIRKNAESIMRNLLELKFNGKTLPWEIRFPDFESKPLVLPPEEGGWALMKVEIITRQQPEAGKLEAFWHDDLQSELIIIIEEGENLGLLSVSTGMSDTILEKEADPDDGSKAASTTPDRSALAESWIISGYRHVIPLGLDHLLFIIGLFLLAPRWKPLMGQSLLFTFAHSITLALAIFGVISLPSKLIEILIAASIAWIGIENLLVRELKPKRLIIVFAFGLLHGMGFASVLGDKLDGISGAQIALPLVGFNVGVELAQITVLICSFLVLWPLRRWTKKVQIVGSVFVALAGLFWMFERIFS
ncbi:HupE/UreJ family protein [Luteolibacter sp. AS25]|uniref:HupE/UreJ family protein n=1 Tax=Luteolibacter sp. AS25 TaxID=3135776 RepID=UPI00398A961F